MQLAFALTSTLRGIPQFYYGDEIGMPGGDDPDNRRDFPGGWTGDSLNAFTVEGRNPDQQKLFAHVQNLLRLRREHPALARGRQWNLASDESSLVFLRDSDEEKILVAFNNSTAARSLNVPVKDTPAEKTPGLTVLFGEARAVTGNGEV